MAKISVIVPVYNMERYLDKALESLRSQTIGDIEIIVVNDGSVDRSLEICEKHKKEDDRIVVLNRENGGVSSARNAGLEVARGEYIAFLDPDDWVDIDMYDEMYKKAIQENLDICICGFLRESGEESVLNEMKIPKEIDREMARYIALNMISGCGIFNEDNTIMGSVCRIIVKREFIEKLSLRFRDDIYIMEDLIFCLELFTRSYSVGIKEEAYYHYRDNPNSALNSYKEDLYGNMKQVYFCIESILRESGLYTEDFRKRLELRYIRMCFWAISNEGSWKNKREIREKINRISDICNDPLLEKAIENFDMSGCSFGQKLRVMSVKNKKIIMIYIYMSLSNRARRIKSNKLS